MAVLGPDGDVTGPDIDGSSGDISAVGQVVEVIYAGPATRFVVDLDAGSRLTAVQQNQQTSSADVMRLRGARVRLSWRAEHVVVVPDETPS